MKTDNSQSIRRNRWFRLASSLMATLFLITCIVSCSEEDISGDITGKYGNLTGADDTVITIGTRGDGYTMKCTYEDFGSGEYIIRKSKCSRISKRKVHFTKRNV